MWWGCWQNRSGVVSSNVCTEAAGSARFVSKPLLGQKRTSWVDAWGQGLMKEGKEGLRQVQTAFPRESWCTSNPGSVFYGKVLCQGAALRAKLCS